MFEMFFDAVKHARRADVERREVQTLPYERVIDDPFPSLIDCQEFQPGGCYFGVRLAGLHVVDARQFSTKRLPLFVGLAEFKHRGQDRTVPFSVGPREITNRLKSTGALNDKDTRPAWIELSNLTFVPPTPVGVGNLSLFVGLYSAPVGDMVSTLLNVIGDLSKSAGAILPAVATQPALDLAKAVYSGFGTLVGLTDMQPLVEAMDGRALSGKGSGYLVVMNAPPGTVDREGFVVRAGKLCRDHALVTDLDYCLVAIERYATLLETADGVAPDLFDSEWQDVVTRFANGEPADVALRKLQGAILGSPALIYADKTAAMGGYLRLYNQMASAAKPGVTLLGSANDLSSRMITALQQRKESGQLAASKVQALFDLLAADKKDPTALSKQSPIALAAQTRAALLARGEGADQDVADVLLRAV